MTYYILQKYKEPYYYTGFRFTRDIELAYRYSSKYAARMNIQALALKGVSVVCVVVHL